MNSGKQYTNLFDAYRIGKDLEEKLCYTIGKALHMWLLDNWKQTEKDAMQKKIPVVKEH